MANGSLTLADYPGKMVEIACSRCGRRGRLRKDRLIEAYGSEICLPDVRHRLARCERHGRLGDTCRVHFPALVPAASVNDR